VPVEPAAESRPAYQKSVDCLTPAGPGFLGLGPLFQLLDCSWLGTAADPIKPFDGKWPLFPAEELWEMGYRKCSD
jgi:hypothetical protein